MTRWRIKRTPIIEDVEINGLAIALVRKSVRNLNLHVDVARKKVRVTVPFSTAQATINDFVQSKFEWIQKHLSRQVPSYVEEKPLRFESGESHQVFGQTLILKCFPRPGKVELNVIESSILEFYFPAKAGYRLRGQYFEDWKREKLYEAVIPMVSKWEGIMEVRVAACFIKKMKTRWGTCNPSARRIWLSLELAKKPLHLIEYVVVHEMVHFFEPSHDARFKSLMTHYLPSWRQLRAQLNATAT